MRDIEYIITYFNGMWILQRISDGKIIKRMYF